MFSPTILKQAAVSWSSV